MAQPKHHTDDWRVKLVLHYDGRNFYGWQAQRNRRTVQGELSALLKELSGSSRRLTAAGRTDRGVHATGQVASTLIPHRFDAEELRRALNAVAPPDLWIESAVPVAHDFHPRRDAISRTYIYRLGVDRDSASPFLAPWCWPFGQEVELGRMVEASDALIGDHDFTAFAKSGEPLRGFRCNVRSAEWRQSTSQPGILEFEMSANRFLHHMVRYVVSTLVEVGTGRRRADEIARLLHNQPGLVTARPAPPQGLFLSQVEYS